MWLPIPSPEAVESFRVRLKKEFNLEVSDEDALEVATRLLQVWIVKWCEERDLRAKVEQALSETGAVD